MRERIRFVLEPKIMFVANADIIRKYFLYLNSAINVICIFQLTFYRLANLIRINYELGVKFQFPATFLITFFRKLKLNRCERGDDFPRLVFLFGSEN